MNIDRIRQLEAHRALFTDRPTRAAIARLELPICSRATVRLNIWRNHNIESLIPVLKPYLSLGGLSPEFSLSSYDDSLSFTGHQKASVDILWLDSTRYLSRMDFNSWLAWLDERLANLRVLSKAPVILATWTRTHRESTEMENLINNHPGAFFADLENPVKKENCRLIENRTSMLAGTPISSSAQVFLARELGCHWLPALIKPPIKAVVVDLDNTLHAGVIAEDGVKGVRLLPEHRFFQLYLKDLINKGVFIALVSRNEYADVKALFTERSDYPLRWNDFSVVEISWGCKADALLRVANKLRIAADAIVFIDDNLGELTNVYEKAPEISLIYAEPDPTLTCRALDYFPGLWRWKKEKEDTFRKVDLQANQSRADLRSKFKDPGEYFRNLNATLIFYFNQNEQLSRLTELSNKTNQFNLNLRRFTHAELSDLLHDPKACVASVQLSDRLSDSGVIALIVGKRDGRALIIQDLCISCRAMGRNLEDQIILFALLNMPIFNGCNQVKFQVSQGPRNTPARGWLAKLIKIDTNLSEAEYAADASIVLEFKAMQGVELKVNSEAI